VVYVNAGQTRSPYYTMLEILREMGVDAPPSGWQFSRLKYEFERVKDGKPTIIAVDEVDTLLYKEREPLIYYLNRQPYISLILISNQFSDLTNLPPRAKSSLQPIPLIFHPYSAEDVYLILKERVKHAFRSGVVEDGVLHAAAKAAEEIGDIRFGFNLLLLVGLAAEASDKRAVRMEDLEVFTSGLKVVFAET
jgi:cell division control protein 6